MRSISVVLLVYNEEANISDVIKSIFDYLPHLTGDFEVVAVDDGSADKTSKILEELKLLYNNLKIIHHFNNKGYGAALISGIKNSEKDLVLIMDADRQFDISEVSKFVPYIGNFDIVAGFRIKRNDPGYRYILGVFFNWLSNMIFGISTKDINCGFKLFRADLIRGMNLVSDGALINAEIMFLSKKMEARIKEIGVGHYPRLYGRQTGANINVIIKALLKIFQLKAKLNKAGNESKNR